MKRTLLTLFITIAALTAFGQGNVSDKGTVIIRDYLIYLSDTVSNIVDTVYFSNDTIFAEYLNGDTDTIPIAGASLWSISGDDITNTNAGQTTIADTANLNGEVFMPNLGSESKVAYVTAWFPTAGATKGKIYPVTIATLGDSLAGDASSALYMPVDSTYYAAYNGAWTDVNTSNESRFRMARKYLVNWFNDLYTAIYSGTSEAIMAMIGDSYQWNYYGNTMRYVSEKYGYGGGYYNMQYALAYANTGHWYIDTNNWTLNNVDRTDAYNFHNRYATSSTAGGELFASATRFNEVRVNYRIAPSDGTFSIQVGAASTPDTIDCNGTAAAGWYYYDISHATKVYPTDTVIIKLLTDTVRIYGIDLRYIEQDANEDKAPIIIHCLGDGGATFDDFYSGKDTATVNVFLDSLNASLVTMTFLDAAAETPYTTSDSLIGLIKQKSALTDILLIGSHDVSGGTVANQLKGYEAVANSRQVAFASSYDFIGDYDDLSAAGLIPDGTHASGAKNFMYQFFDTYLFPQSVNRYGTLTATDLNVWDDVNVYGDATISGQVNDGLRIGDGYYMYDASNNLAIVQIHKSGWVGDGASVNVALGENALNGLLSGDNNVAVGGSALQATATHNYNVAVGRTAGASCVSSENVFIGGLAGQNFNGAVGSNVMIGYGAGQNNDGGINTIIGRGAGATGNGSNNTFIGYRAGYAATGSTSVFIGNDAGYNETGSNKLYIENSNSATPLIYGDFASDYINIVSKLHIGASLASPAVELEVAGEFDYASNAYGLFGFDSATNVITIGTTDTWYHIAKSGFELMTAHVASNLTLSNDTIYFDVGGVYDITANVSFSGNNGEIWQLAFMENGTDRSIVSERYTSTNDVGNMSVHSMFTAAANDYVVLQINNTTDADDPTVISLAISVRKLDAP